MKKSVSSLLIITVFVFLSLAYQDCAPSSSSSSQASTSVVVSGTPTALGEQASLAVKGLAKKMQSLSGASYSVQQIQVGGSTVSEYVDDNGVVFALTWRGLSFPDLSQLLGSYYGNYQQEKARVGRAHGVRVENIETAQLVVRRSGHMRDLHGQAYDARLFPQGFQVGDLQ